MSCGLYLYLSLYFLTEGRHLIQTFVWYPRSELFIMSTRNVLSFDLQVRCMEQFEVVHIFILILEERLLYLIKLVQKELIVSTQRKRCVYVTLKSHILFYFLFQRFDFDFLHSNTLVPYGEPLVYTCFATLLNASVHWTL